MSSPTSKIQFAVEVIKLKGRTAIVRRVDGHGPPITCNTSGDAHVGKRAFATFERPIGQWSLTTK